MDEERQWKKEMEGYGEREREKPPDDKTEKLKGSFKISVE